MTSIELAIGLLIMAIGGLVVRKTYFFVPLNELKRRATHGDVVAQRLFRAAAYGDSLRGLLWLYIGLTTAGSIILFSRELSVWASLLLVGPLLWISFSVIPATRVTGFGTRLTMIATPLIAWLLNYLHPTLNRGAQAVAARYKVSARTGMYEREDLIRLIERQLKEPENRVSHEELEIVKRVLNFGDYRVSDILIPRKAIKTVQASETIGPVLIDEVHKSQQDYVLVKEKTKGDFVGTMVVGKLGLGSQGKVADIMDHNIYYLHENDSLAEALHAFFVTNHSVFVVINSFEEYVGVVSIENLLKQLLGHVPGDEFDQYTDKSAVALRHHTTKPANEETSVKTDDEMIE